MKLLYDRHKNVGNVSRDGLDVDGVDADAVVSVAVQKLKDELQGRFFSLFDHHLTLLVPPARVLSRHLHSHLLIFDKFFLAIDHPIEVFVQHETPGKTQVTLGPTVVCAAVGALLFRLQHGLKGALVVEVASLPALFNFIIFYLQLPGLLVEAF